MLFYAYHDPSKSLQEIDTIINKYSQRKGDWFEILRENLRKKYKADINYVGAR